MTLSQDILPTLLGVFLLIGVTTAILALAGVPRRWDPALAILRGTVQLAVISTILTGVIANPWWVAVALVVMFGAATTTSTRRLGWSVHHLGVVCTAMGASVVLALSVVFLTGAIELTARYALAIGGIVIGGAMSTATLSGRRLVQAADDRWDQIEALLALGATPRQSTLAISRHALAEALIPSTDQTRTTGLVTLPGAFVGAIFGGISPLEAGRFQIVVLASIMAAAAVTAATVAFALGPTVRPGARGSAIRSGQ